MTNRGREFWWHAGGSNESARVGSNISEREMKRVVLNRKNSLFVGNQRGGRMAA